MKNRIVKDIEEIVAAMRTVPTAPPYYMYGHIAEVNARLMGRNANPKLKEQKYPLVVLRLDTPAKVSGGILHYKLNIAILAKTDMRYTAEERENKIFIPILNPLYDSFMNALRDSGNFSWKDFQDYPPHTRVDRYFWGTPQDKEVKNILTDPLDAIELVDLEINSEIKNC